MQWRFKHRCVLEWWNNNPDSSRMMEQWSRFRGRCLDTFRKPLDYVLYDHVYGHQKRHLWPLCSCKHKNNIKYSPVVIQGKAFPGKFYLDFNDVQHYKKINSRFSWFATQKCENWRQNYNFQGFSRPECLNSNTLRPQAIFQIQYFFRHHGNPASQM